MGSYTTISGDEWDLICYKYYGTEMVMDDVIKANPRHMNTTVFGAGIVLNMPDLSVEQAEQESPPWMR